jgi:hypothetical protein
MHNLAIARIPITLSSANLNLKLVSDVEDGGFLDDYELEDNN